MRKVKNRYIIAEIGAVVFIVTLLVYMLSIIL